MLTETVDAAGQLQAIIKAEDWGGDVTLRDDRNDIDIALGSCPSDQGIVTVWWD